MAISDVPFKWDSEVSQRQSLKDSNASDKGLNDGIFDKELTKPLAGSIIAERNF